MTENGNHPGGHFSDEYRICAAGTAVCRRMGHLRARDENQNLPGFVVLPDYRSLPFSGSQQWGPGFLPASYQGTMMQWKGDPIADLRPASASAERDQKEQLDLLRTFNQSYLENNFTNPDLQGRIDAYELAYRMQAEVPSRSEPGERIGEHQEDVRARSRR